jgi:DNA end-binding protein Ku
MAGRAIWKGIIRFEEIRVPVKLYSGIADRKVHFRMLHGEDQIPVVQKMVHPHGNKPVGPQEIMRGYEFEPGRFIIFHPVELSSLEPEKTRDIDILEFVDPFGVGHQYYDRLYYLGPDAAGQPYALLAAALEKARSAAIIRWNMRKKTYFGVLYPADGLLQVSTLRYQDQIVDLTGLTRPTFRELEAQERRMADQLVQALENQFEPEVYRDQYREQVVAMVQAKAKGQRIEAAPKPKPKPQVVSLTDMLKQSVAQVQRERKTG